MPNIDRRQQLHTALNEAIGPDTADTLMEMVPTYPWDQLVTKADLSATEDALRSEMGALRVELKNDIADLRADNGSIRQQMGALRVELKNDIADLRVDNGSIRQDLGALHADNGSIRHDLGALHADNGSIRHDLGALSAKVDGLIPTMWRANLAFTVAVLGLLLAFTGLR